MPLSNLAFLSSKPAFQNFKSGTFDIVVSGIIAPSGNSSWSGSTSFSRENSLVKTYISQNNTPVDISTDYTAGALLPLNTRNTIAGPFVNVGCTVVGVPTATSIPLVIKNTYTASGLSTVITLTNPYAGNMTLTNTTFTIRYVAYLPTML